MDVDTFAGSLAGGGKKGGAGKRVGIAKNPDYCR